MENTHKKYPSKMFLIMVFIMIITVQNVGISMVGAASWDEVESFHFYGERRETKIEAVSGEDDSEKTEALMLEKFRVLLGLRSLHQKRKTFEEARETGSPAPAPSPTTAEAAGPAPVPTSGHAARKHSHHHRHPRPRPMLPIHEYDNQDKDNVKRKRIIIETSISIGVALVICVLGLLCVSRRMNKHQKKATKPPSLCGDISSQNIATKVRHDPGFELCYLNNATTALEPQACLKGPPDSLNTTSVVNKGYSYEKTDSLEEATRRGPRESSTHLGEEITSVQEHAESSNYESDVQSPLNGENSVCIDPHSSEDESFHSFCDSRSSSNLRLSNVSLGSFSDPKEVLFPNQSNRSPRSPTTAPAFNIDVSASLNSSPPRSPADGTAITENTPPSHPPPPPPPPPHRTSQRSGMIQTSCPRNSDLPSGSCQTPGNVLVTAPKDSKSPSNIPPPPCPPPFRNGNRSSFQGPPPPPGQLPIPTPLGKDGFPLPKLKPLHWDKVRAAPDRSMVWDKLRCSSFELNEEMIESLFGYNLKTVFNNDEGKSKSPSPSKHVLEPKRLQNITILSKALNVTAEKVCEALIQGGGLCTQQLEALVKMAPTKEEEGKLSSYKGNINELGSAEKLVKKMLTIPNAFQRAEAMLFRATFDDEIVHLRNSFSMLEEACKELRSSRLFLKLLEAVLKTGNRMNVGTIRGGARAFKLDTLLKLADVKGTDGKTTLLHFVVQEIIRAEGMRMSDSIMGQIDRNSNRRTVEEKEEDYIRMGLELVSGLSTELCNVKRTASIDLDVLATSVSNLSDGMSKLQQLVNKDLHKDARHDHFVYAMKTFLSHAENNLKELQAEEDKVLLRVREITEYYHGDVSKDEANPLRIFVIVRDFLGMLDQVCRELKSLKTPRTPNPLAPFR